MKTKLNNTKNQTIEILEFDKFDKTYLGRNFSHQEKGAFSLVYFYSNTALLKGLTYTGRFDFDPTEAFSKGFPTFTQNQ